MASINKAIIVGNVGKDPEIRYMPNGEAVANFSIATSDSWKDKSGVKQERTEWHNIVAYRKLAEIIGQYVKSGMPLYIEGKLQTRKWEKDGITRYSTEIIADEMQMLGARAQDNDSGHAKPQAQQNNAPKAQGDSFDDMESDLPF